MVMQSLRNGSSGGFLKYILFGLLGMSVGGLVLMDVTGVYNTGGLGGSDVAKVENKNITIQQFDRNLRRSLARYNLSVEQAYEMGVVDELLSGEIRSTYLMIESEKMGMKLSKENIAKRIAEVIKPQMNDGETLQDALNRMLKYQAMPEAEFVNNVEREAIGNIIMDAIQNAVTPPQDEIAKTLFQFSKQTRDIEFLEFKNTEITDVKQPEDEEILNLYNSVKGINYKTPEYRSAEIIVFDPEIFDANAEVSEKEIKDHYNDNKDSYAIGEQYIVTQITIKDEAAINEIYKSVQDGKTLAEIAASSLGENASYVENVSFETAMMLPEFNKAVTSVNIGETTKPFKTILGYHITKVEDVKEPSILPLSEVSDSIKKELMANKKADALYDIIATIDNNLSDGMSYAEAKESNEGAQIYISSPLTSDATEIQIKGDQENPFDSQSASIITQALFENEDDEPSPILELDDGRFVSARVLEKQDADYLPLEEVKDEIITQYISDVQNAENEEHLRKIMAETEATGSSLEALAKEEDKYLQSLKELGISGEVAKPLLQENLPIIFKATPGEGVMGETEGGYALLNVTGFNIPEVTDADKAEINQLKAALIAEAQEDAFLLYLRKLNEKYDAQINKPLLDQVYGSKNRGN